MANRARGGLVAALTAACLAAVSASAGAGASAPAPASAHARFRTTTLDAKGLERLAARPWLRLQSRAASGPGLKVAISLAYASDPGALQRWTDFFTSLLHGPELDLLDAYIAPLPEVEEICGGEALGCYGSNHLVVMGEASFGISAETVARHEYGHHVAANRLNPPWPAADWGTKRWASAAGVCGRVAAGTAFPGDEDMNYELNPGEAFAESYRVLVETNGTAAGYDWPILDESFRPTAETLAAVREDVLHPWAGPTERTIQAKFLRRSRTWTTTVTTPLDGDLRVQVTNPGGGADGVALLSGDGQTVLANGAWSTSGGKSIEYRVCGGRSLKVRVTRGGAAVRFTLRVQAP
jgi:hypothetical protein